jgi:hypothetical protein
MKNYEGVFLKSFPNSPYEISEEDDENFNLKIDFNSFPMFYFFITHKRVKKTEIFHLLTSKK